MKNAFYLIFKLFSFLRFLNFSPTFLVMLENVLIRKLMLILKLMISSTGKLIITIHMLKKLRQLDNETWSFKRI